MTIAELSWRRALPSRKDRSAKKRRTQVLRRRIRPPSANREDLKLQAKAQRRPRQGATRKPAKDLPTDLLRRSGTAKS
ncbi:unnamed protein product [Sphagnum jensenii]|uniref:Uncharacterized protein n=1 Tax=Sphagnum jensenii TaxID=128206 RepID=A0ABP0VPH1_9BRYO